ncbi:MAG: ribonuclease HII [Psychroserpens sp.]|uniref:ribonuclease HII n=1 Tax=Psychroserpens sp. TaxID=2020870 RepID=UPI003CA49D5D
MKNHWFILLLVLSSCLYYCKNPNTKITTTLSLVPENTSVIIKINSLESLDSGLKNNALIKASNQYKCIDQFTSLLLPAIRNNKDKGILALSKNENDSLAITYIIPMPEGYNLLDSIDGLTIEKSVSLEREITKFRYETTNYFSKTIDSILFISTSLELTKNASVNEKMNADLELLNGMSNPDKMISIFINAEDKTLSPIQFTDSTLNASQFSNITIVNGELSQSTIHLTGITKAKDSTQSLINLFKHTIPQENRIASILPSAVGNFKSVTFNDYSIFNENLIQHKFKDSTHFNDFKFQNIVEIGQAAYKDQEIIAIRSLDMASTVERFDLNLYYDDFRSVSLYSLSETDDEIFSAFGPFITVKNATHFITIGDFFVFSNPGALRDVITNYQNNTALSETDAYKALQLNLSDESSLLLFGNSKLLNTVLNLNFNENKSLDLSGFDTSAVQYSYDTDFAHVNAVFMATKSKRTNGTISEEFNISVDAELASAPQFVKNYTSNAMDIIVQDIKNNLYLVSNEGKVYWKKQLDGRILGTVNQIDTYKNGRLQFVFNTAKTLYVLDKNGNNVNAFPKQFKDNITQPVSVFDYDTNKKYRLMIVQDKTVFMYDKHGNTVKGFTFTKSKNTITSKPQHFRINRKDYIVFTSGNKLVILDRVGKSRVDVKETISFSENDIYLYDGKFTTSDTNGELLEVNQSGSVNHTNLNVNNDHRIATTSKTLVVMNENTLTIKSKSVELDYGNYTAPKIFYINDKIYVTVTDLQSKKGYLFDSQAKAIANFPVYANSSLELENIDDDSALEVVTKGDDNAIIVYEFQ